MTDKTYRNFPVAVVGMQGRFPDAYDAKDFWNNLVEGHDTIGLVPSERWDWKKIFGTSANESENTTVNAAGFMPYADCFDHKFFGYMPKEVEAMDPQQRLFLQTAYAALEDAGYAPSSLAGSKTGVFVGIGNADYPLLMRRDSAVFDVYRATGLALTCIANRLSFYLDTHGPSESIDTACSGSLVAIHRAIQSMQYGECERAIVGGVNLLLGPELFIAFDKAGMLSKSARSRTFDESANGYVRGEGVAALVLCPLEVAEKNGDYIYGVIEGSAENHGGRAHSFTAPNATAQATVIKDAWASSGLDFRQASMIETHGTGTPLGDPIEVSALHKVNEEFNLDSPSVNQTHNQQSIALGALKSHVGHLEATAGVAGVIKALLSIKNRMVPANQHHTRLNPHIKLDNTPFYVPTENVSLNSGVNNKGELYAGISSFGFGGVNSHIVIKSHDNKLEQQYREKKGVIEQASSPYLIPISAKDSESLCNRVQQLIFFLEESINGTDGFVSTQKIAQVLCNNLGIALTDKLNLAETTLVSEKVSVASWLRTLKALEPIVGRSVKVVELADCVSFQDIIKRIVKIINTEKVIRTDTQRALCSRVAATTKEVQQVMLEEISYSLTCGRDTMKERLAIVVSSKGELLNALREFVKSPEIRNVNIFRHTIRHKDPLIKRPPLSTELSSNYLRSWAAHWVGTKSAVIDWQEIHAQEMTPLKIPLPSYPFRLDRHWYKATKNSVPEQQSILMSELTETNTYINVVAQSEIKATEDKRVEGRVNLSVAPLCIVAAWKDCWNQSKRHMPATSSSLILLLEYALHKTKQSTVCLEDVVFGRPHDFSDHHLAYNQQQVADKNIIQCLTRDNHQVQVQASIAAESESLDLSQNVNEDKLYTTNVENFYLQHAHADHVISNKYRCLKSLDMADTRLVMGIDLPDWNSKKSAFWIPLWATIQLGISFLGINEISRNLYLPWTIKSIVFNSKFAKKLKVITISFDLMSDELTVNVIDSEANIAVRMMGVLLRETTHISATRSLELQLTENMLIKNNLKVNQ